ncbi:MAG: hypothetical protein ACI4M9_04465 [Succinivibrio sp.]
MSKVYCMSYSDYGYLLTNTEFEIKTVKLENYEYDVFENILKADRFVLKRHFLKPSALFEDEDDSLLPLPEEIARLDITYDSLPVYVTGTFEFESAFSGLKKNSFGLVLLEPEALTVPVYNLEDLAEDLVMLASNGIDLNEVP